MQLSRNRARFTYAPILRREQGLLAADEGRTDEGRRLLREAVGIHEKAAEKHVSHVGTLLALAQLERRLGDGVQASVHTRAALERAAGAVRVTPRGLG